MSLRIARERLGLAAAVVFLSFVCSSTRLLVTQQRLELTKDALRREASRDGLTGLWNHKAILTILDRELLRAERDNEPVGLIMADMDHFKNINDSRGHAAGDSVLRIIASSMAAVVRPYDSVGRYGGEEFVIVAPGCGLAETCELAERVRAHVAACNIVGRRIGGRGQPQSWCRHWPGGLGRRKAVARCRLRAVPGQERRTQSRRTPHGTRRRSQSLAFVGSEQRFLALGAVVSFNVFSFKLQLFASA